MHNKRYIDIVILITAMAGLLFGYDTGVIATTLVFLKQDFSLTIFEQEALVSILPFGALLGSLAIGAFNNKLGRRRLLLFTALSFIVGTISCAITYDIFWIFLGRFIVGMAIGVASFSAPLYISEIAPAKIRGSLVLINTVMVTGGILLAYIAGFSLASFKSWHLLFALGLIPAIILAIGVLFLPSSPRWLLKKNHYEKALLILQKLRGKREVFDELNEIQALINLEHSPIPSKRSAIIPLLGIGVLLAIIQQASGINAILYYAPDLFKILLPDTIETVFLSTMAVGATNFLMTIVAVFFIDKMGRRALLIGGLSCMSASLFLLGHGLSVHWNSITLFFLLLSYIATYAISIGCIFWLVIAEILPFYMRARAMSIAAAVNWGANLVVSMTALSMIHSLGLSTTFMIYAFLCLLSVVYCYFKVPETKKISLEQIEVMLAH